MLCDTNKEKVLFHHYNQWKHRDKFQSHTSVAADKSYKNYKNPLELLMSSTEMCWIFLQLGNRNHKKIFERIVGLCGCAIRNCVILSHLLLLNCCCFSSSPKVSHANFDHHASVHLMWWCLKKGKVMHIP